MQLIRGSCHCGNIRFQLTWPLGGPEIPVRACSCSFCVRHGAAYTSHPDATLRAEIGDPRLVSRYSFATATAEFVICTRCGALPFATSRIDDRVYAVVNVNTFEDVDPECLTSAVTDFDGESVEDRLARRASKWIADVVIAEEAGCGPIR